MVTSHLSLPFLGQVTEVWLEDEESTFTDSARVAAPRVRARPDHSAKRAWGAREGGAAAGAAEGPRAGVEGRCAALDADAPEGTREIERGEEQGIKVGPAGPVAGAQKKWRHLVPAAPAAVRAESGREDAARRVRRGKGGGQGAERNSRPGRRSRRAPSLSACAS